MEKMKILAVDDEPINLMQLEGLLEEHYQLETAENGKDALEKVRTFSPDLILLDIMMPVLNGLEVCCTLKKDPVLKDIPVIMLTSQTTDKDFQKGFEAGAMDYIRKPFNEVELMARISNALQIVASVKEIKANQKRLIELQKQAERANQMKSEFLANMSHEIRTPMNAILGFAGMLEEDEENPVKKKNLKTIVSAGNNLLNLINDILDFSKIEAGKLDISPAPFSLSGLLKKTKDIFSIRAKEKDLAFNVEVADSVPALVNGDELRINQVLVNIIGNAFKFTEKGGITLTADYSNGSAEIKIIDTGIGVPQDKIEKIFAPFSQADSTTTKQYGGTGLGLSITRRLVQLMDGDLIMESEVGKGSVFTVTLPLPAIDKKSLPVDIDKTVIGEELVRSWLENYSDDPEMQDLVYESIKLLFQRLNPLVEAVLNNDSEQIKTIAHELKGFTGEMNMLEISKYAGTINDEVCKEVYDLGIINAAMSKLKDIAYTIPGKYRHGKPSQVSAGKGKPSEVRILVAEDNAINQQVMQKTLSRRGLGCAIAGNGMVALEMLKKNKYDLLLLDMSMPVMDGMETIKHIREDEQLRDLYVIAVTAHAIQGYGDTCIQAGCNDYLSKPVDREKLYRKLSDILGVDITVTPFSANGSDPSPTAGGDEPAPPGKSVSFDENDKEALSWVISELREVLEVFSPDRVRSIADRVVELAGENKGNVLKEKLYTAADNYDEDIVSEVIALLT